MELVRQQTTSKRRLKLGDIAELLQIKKFVIRSWEKELGLAPQGGFYGADALELFKKIKQLVLVDKNPLEQVKIILAAHGESIVQDCSVKTDSSLSAEELLIPSFQVMPLVEDMHLEEAEKRVQAQDALVNISDELVAAKVVSMVEGLSFQDQQAELLPSVIKEQSDSHYEGATEVSFSSASSIESAENISQQRFMKELAFFKQELLKFQRLLNA